VSSSSSPPFEESKLEIQSIISLHRSINLVPQHRTQRVKDTQFHSMGKISSCSDVSRRVASGTVLEDLRVLTQGHMPFFESSGRTRYSHGGSLLTQSIYAVMVSLLPMVFHHDGLLPIFLFSSVSRYHQRWHHVVLRDGVVTSELEFFFILRNHLFTCEKIPLPSCYSLLSILSRMPATRIDCP